MMFVNRLGAIESLQSGAILRSGRAVPSEFVARVLNRGRFEMRYGCGAGDLSFRKFKLALDSLAEADIIASSALMFAGRTRIDRGLRDLIQRARKM